MKTGTEPGQESVYWQPFRSNRPIEEIFPALAKGGFQITSALDKRYNCVAYAAGDTANWWWPLPADVEEFFWPAGVTRAETLTAFRDAFASLGFTPCDSQGLEPDFEKIALFANLEAVPLHAARQQADGRWTSKLGEREDIDHALHDLEGECPIFPQTTWYNITW